MIEKQKVVANNRLTLNLKRLQNCNNFTFNLENCNNLTLNLQSCNKQRPHLKPKLNHIDMMTMTFESKPNMGMCTSMMGMWKTNCNKLDYPKSIITHHLKIWGPKPRQCWQWKPKNSKIQWCATIYLKITNVKK
jgi:hypothetical protein